MQDEDNTARSGHQCSQDSVRSAIQAAFGAALAALVTRLRSIDAAEDALQEAVLKAWEKWPATGIPEQPAAWLIVCATNVFRDHYRREARIDRAIDPSSTGLADPAAEWDSSSGGGVGGDEDILRLIFMCSHPGIAPENQLALCLRMLMGFSYAEIARALLITTATLEQRITRAKRKIASSGISFELPRADSLPLRLDSVRQILYLIFNEGYHGSGEVLIDRELCRQAIRLTRALCRGFPDPENFGLLALMLFNDARAPARIGEGGELITLDSQNRTLWKRSQIEEADVLLQKALLKGELGSYQLQAAIAGVHSLAESAQLTDWTEIVGLYRRLYRQQPNAVVGLNFAVALMMIEELADAERLLVAFENELRGYSPYYAALSKLHALSGRQAEATAALRTAAEITGSKGERGHYQLQLRDIEGAARR